MNIEEFETTLRRFIRQVPFQPFEVEFLDGRRLEVKDPAVVFAGGAATYFNADFNMIEFASEEVCAIRPLAPEPTPPGGEKGTGMSIEEFDSTLRRFVRQQPFQPFEVELHDGRRIDVKDPTVAFGGGAATYVTPDYALIDFLCKDVRAIRQLTPEAAS